MSNPTAYERERAEFYGLRNALHQDIRDALATPNRFAALQGVLMSTACAGTRIDVALEAMRDVLSELLLELSGREEEP